MTYDSTALDAELKAAGLPIVGCSSDGRVDWIGAPTTAQIAQAEAIKTAHDPFRRANAESASRTRLRELALKLEQATATPTEIREALAKLIRRLVP